MLSIRTILHPTDFSGSSSEAFAVAAVLARDYGARLVLLHVMKQPTQADGMGLVPFDPEMYRDELQDKLDQLAVRAPGVQLEQRLAQGSTVPAILEAAQQTQCDLIVMGAHGWSGLRRLLMGSVAEAVVRKAPCPVLTIQTPAGSEKRPAERTAMAAAGPAGRPAH
jgi:nucleotide-binding universal stress UspA family protein